MLLAFVDAVVPTENWLFGAIKFPSSEKRNIPPLPRFRLEGEGEREVWLYEDGTAAGWRYRDPVAKGVTEVRVAHAVSHLGGQARVVTEGKLDDGWRRAVASRPTEKLFRRPGQ